MNDRSKLHELGTLQDLPGEYVAALRDANLVPLWPALRAMMPPGAARTTTQPTLWPWQTIRPLLLRAGELTPMDKAERRVLVLANPGRGLDHLQASSVIYLGMQLVLPGETAPNHRHTPNAARIVVEGAGACTIVSGEKCVMQPGDLVLTPTGLWHEHRHEGTGPFIWLDVLDLPVMVYLDVSYVMGGALQEDTRPPAAYAASVVPRIDGERTSARYPQLRYDWTRTREALRALAAGRSTRAAGRGRVRQPRDRRRLSQHDRVHCAHAARRRGRRRCGACRRRRCSTWSKAAVTPRSTARRSHSSRGTRSARPGLPASGSPMPRAIGPCI